MPEHRCASDHSAQPEYWLDLSKVLRRYLAQRLAPDSVDDVLGDLMLKVVNQRDALAQAGNPQAWLYRVAANAIADHYRRRAVERRTRRRAAAQSIDLEQDDDADGESASRELAACLEPFIQRMSARDAEALRLVSFEGLSQVAAAARLEIPLPTMKSRIQRARARLRAALLECCTVKLDRRGRVVAYAARAGNEASCCSDP